ncbi:hypothetical protein ACFQX6_62070 [Streptosporangium lutulentum]
MIVTDLFVRAPLVSLAGETATGLQVTGVRVAARTASVSLAAGELLVLLDPDRTAWRLDAELSRAAEAGAAGLLVPGTESLLRSTVLLAERLGMPVLGCREDPLETAMRLAVLVASPEVDVARRVLAAHRVLDAGATALAEMRDRTSAVLGTEVTVLARDGAVLLGPFVPARFRTNVPVRQRLAGGGVAVPVLAPDGRTPELWLVTGGTAGDEEVLAVAAAAVQRSLALRRVDVERDARRRSGLLGELLQAGDDPGPRCAAARRRRAGDWTAGTRAFASG